MDVALNARVKQIRQALHLSQRQFARAILISQSYYASLEMGKQAVTERLLHIISTKFNVNQEWVATGQGQMFDKTPPDAKLEQLIEVFNELNGLFQDYVLLQTKELLKIQKQTSP